MAAATFHGSGHEDVADIGDAYQLLRRCSARSSRARCSRVALLASGQNATLTGTLAGQIVMEGFLNIRLRPWLRRLITRLIAIVPAVIVVVLYGERGTGPLLILSQVILSLQLPFAVFPLVMFTGDARKMGEFVAPLWMKALAWPVAVDHRRAQRVAALADVLRGTLTMYTQHPGRHRALARRPHHPRRTSSELARADRREAAARARRRRLGGAALRRAEAARVGGDAATTAPTSSSSATELTGRGFETRAHAGAGRSGDRADQGRRERAGRSDRDVHARPPLPQRPAPRQTADRVRHRVDHAGPDGEGMKEGASRVQGSGFRVQGLVQGSRLVQGSKLVQGSRLVQSSRLAQSSRLVQSSRFVQGSMSVHRSNRFTVQNPPRSHARGRDACTNPETSGAPTLNRGSCTNPEPSGPAPTLNV